MSSNNSTGSAPQFPHRAHVDLAPLTGKELTALRQTLWGLGYLPIPNRDKRAMHKGWNQLSYTDRSIALWVNSRATRTKEPATGLVIAGGLAGLDMDMPDESLAKAFRERMFEIAPGILDSGLERGRSDDSPKRMFLARRAPGEEPFTLKSRKWTPVEGDETVVFQLEIFASERNKEGKARRQIGAFGPHTVDDATGAVKLTYKWYGASPLERGIETLPSLPRATAEALIAAFDALCEGRGFSPVKGHHGGEVVPRDLYDLDVRSRFDGEGFSDLTLVELIELYWANEEEELRISGSFTGFGSGRRLDRCHVGWSGSRATGHITIYDYDTEVTHRPAEYAPTPDSSMQRLGSLLASMRDRDREEDENKGDNAARNKRAESIGDDLRTGALSHVRFALALSELLEGGIAYHVQENDWYAFRDIAWERSGAFVRELASTFCLAVGERLPFDRAGYKQRERLGAGDFARNVERFMRDHRQHLIRGEVFDQAEMLLGTPAGVVELDSGRLRPMRRFDLVSRLTRASVAEAGTPLPMFQRFLDEITDGDKDLQRFLQQWSGQGLVGSVAEQRIAVFYGGGRNGKGALMRMTGSVAGDYFTMAVENFLVRRRGAIGEGHPTQIKKLRGARMVHAPEPPDNSQWDENRIKAFTGGDMQSGRGMREDFQDFMPQCALTVAANIAPQLSSVTPAIKDRFMVVPFEAYFDASKIDTSMEPRILHAESSAILRWMVDGVIDWHRAGRKLAVPAAVRVTSAEYIRGEDAVAEFFADRVIFDRRSDEERRRDGERRIYKKDLRQAAQEWEQEHRGRSLSPHLLFRRLRQERGLKDRRDDNGEFFEGAVIVTAAEMLRRRFER